MKKMKMSLSCAVLLLEQKGMLPGKACVMSSVVMRKSTSPRARESVDSAKGCELEPSQCGTTILSHTNCALSRQSKINFRGR